MLRGTGLVSSEPGFEPVFFEPAPNFAYSYKPLRVDLRPKPGDAIWWFWRVVRLCDYSPCCFAEARVGYLFNAWIIWCFLCYSFSFSSASFNFVLKLFSDPALWSAFFSTSEPASLSACTLVNPELPLACGCAPTVAAAPVVFLLFYFISFSVLFFRA